MCVCVCVCVCACVCACVCLCVSECVSLLNTHTPTEICCLSFFATCATLMLVLACALPDYDNYFPMLVSE
jgi:hypothetical protein